MKAAGLVAVTLPLVMSLSGCLSLGPMARNPPVATPAPSCAQPSVGTAGRTDKTPEPLTLEQCIETARANNPSLAAGIWDVQTTLAQWNIAAAEHRLARTREELVFNVSSTFYTILGQRPLIESLQFSTKILNKQRQRVLDVRSANS